MALEDIDLSSDDDDLLDAALLDPAGRGAGAGGPQPIGDRRRGRRVGRGSSRLAFLATPRHRVGKDGAGQLRKRAQAKLVAVDAPGRQVVVQQGMVSCQPQHVWAQ